jgi:predicted lipoprotein with Yx(FWY)xxD motif
MTRKITVLIAIAAPLAAALIAAGCGSSASGSAYSAGPYGSAAAASASVRRATGPTKVGVASSRLGRILVDSKGRTLYLFEKDKHRRSACYGACATYWPPLLTHGKPVVRHGLKQSLLGTTRRANGSQQVTYAGHPLYRFTLDTKPGQTNGEGLQDFGGRWDVVSPAGRKVESNG